MSRIKSSGFTLIEILVTIALVGVLTTIATISYKNYIYNARVEELVQYAHSQSLLVNDYMAKNPLITAIKSSSCTPIATTTTVNTTVTKQYGVNNSCQGFANSVANAFATGVTITAYISPVMGTDGTLSWVCSVIDNTSAISKYAPSTCQTPVPTYP